MLGSKSHYFHRSPGELFVIRKNLVEYLSLKGYTLEEARIYIKAFDYFCNSPSKFDGATIVKDLTDLPGLDLDAMLHDYHYLNYQAATNFITKWKSDWIYAKGQERKGKGQYSSFSRFVGLTLVGIGFVPYALIKRGKITRENKDRIQIDYNILIKS
ncbi:hypothetical protein ACI6PS_02470 [Flavobacterium sp. PLA-1-15]|uniref:hypothetical protein n=1 Tax=Flavobacterium sp. PLA-1-15 TaxID=3380533 RepID=UPI003B796341